jgi:FG-GAP-like repeat/FG-GAP repeat
MRGFKTWLSVASAAAMTMAIGITATATSGDAFFGTRATLAADVSGDGISDLVAVNDGSTWVELSSGSGFGSPTQWSTQPFFGARATLAADVNGDGKVDLVAVNHTNTWVMLSTGTGFSSPTLWSATPFFGTRGTFAASVNGDLYADLVAVNDNSTWVMLSNSTGTGFLPPTQWSSSQPFFGSRATRAEDLNGDNKTDLVAVNADSTWVMLSNSTGTGFLPPTLWSSSQPFNGTRAVLAGDFNGDLNGDLVAVSATLHASIWVMLSNSTGTGFLPPTAWSTSAFFGSRATLVGDFNGDGKSDLVAVNDNSTWVMLSNGSGTAFLPPASW